MKCVWKKNFQIQVEGKILFMITFEDIEDLESIVERRPWLSRRQLVVFE